MKYSEVGGLCPPPLLEKWRSNRPLPSSTPLCVFHNQQSQILGEAIPVPAQDGLPELCKLKCSTASNCIEISASSLWTSCCLNIGGHPSVG